MRKRMRDIFTRHPTDTDAMQLVRFSVASEQNMTQFIKKDQMGLELRGRTQASL